MSNLAQFFGGGGVAIGQVIDAFPRSGKVTTPGSITFRGQQFELLNRVKQLDKASYPALYELLGDGVGVAVYVQGYNMSNTATIGFLLTDGTNLVMSGTTATPSREIVRSTDGGANWSNVYTPGADPVKGGCANGMFWYGSGTTVFWTSLDGGATWASRTLSSPGQPNDVAYGGGVYVLAAPGGTNRIFSSTDGITWTNRSTTNATFVAYGNGVFVTAYSSTGNWMYSADGTTWTGVTAPSGAVYGYARSLHFCELTNKFVVSLSGQDEEDQYYYATSTDGTSWTIEEGTVAPWVSWQSTSPPPYIWKIGSVYYAAPATTTGFTLFRSTDLITWEKTGIVGGVSTSARACVIMDGVIYLPDDNGNYISTYQAPILADTVVLRPVTGTVYPYQWMRVK